MSGEAATRKIGFAGNKRGICVLAGDHIEFGPFALRSGTSRRRARGLGQSRRLRLRGCGGERHLKYAADSAHVWHSGAAGSRGRYGTTRSANRRIVGGTQQRRGHRLHRFASNGHGKVAECSRCRPRASAIRWRLSSADMQLLPDEVHVRKLNAKAADTSWTWLSGVATGLRDSRRMCRALYAEHQPDRARAHEGLGEAAAKKRPWYRVLQSSAKAGPSFLARCARFRTYHCSRLQVQSRRRRRVSAKVSLDAGKLQI